MDELFSNGFPLNRFTVKGFIEMTREIKYFIAILLYVILLIAAGAGTAHAQGSRKDDIVFNAQGRPMAGATVRVCTSAATGQPCTPLAQVYSDPALTQALANPLSADGMGNYSFYAAPGRYMIEFSGPGILPKQIPNVILPSDPSTPTFTSVTTTSGISAFSLSLTGNLTVNGSTAVAGSLTVGGLPVPTTNQDNQWTAGQRFKGPIPWRDISGYMPAGGCSSNTTPTDPTTTGTIASGSQSLALASARDFKNGCGIAVLNAGPTSVIPTPNQGCSISSIARASNVVTVTCAAAHGIPVYGSDHAQGIQITGVTDSSYNGTFDVTGVGDTTHFTYSQTAANSSSSGGTATMQFGYAHGVTGSTTYNYKVSAVDGLGGMSAASSAITITTGNATLNTSNYNWINIGVASNIAASVPHEWVIYSDKGLGGGYSCVGTAFTNAYSDFGMAMPCPAFAPATPPASATPQVLNAIISAGGGTTTLTLSVAASTNATTQKTYHDESSFLNSCINDDIADKNGGFAIGAYGCYLPAGNYFLNGPLGTDNNTSVNGTTIYVAGSVYLNIFPWYISQSEVYALGLGDSGGNAQFSQARTTILYVAPELASAVVIRGGSHVEFSGFDMFNLQGHGIWVGQVPYLNAPNSYRFDNDIITLATGAAGAPLVFDANVIGVWSNHTSLTPSNSAIGLPSIYFTMTGWDNNPNCCMYFDNLTTASRGVKVDAPGGNGSGGGHNSLFFKNWISESLTSSELGLVVHDEGPNAPGAISSGIPLNGISVHNLNSSDPANGPAAYALLTETGSAAQITADVYNVGAFGLLLNCGPNTTACNDRPSIVANVNGGPTGGSLGGSIQLGGNNALDVEMPILSQIGYPSLGTFQPAWAQVLPPPNTFTITGTGAGSLAADTYCMAVEGRDARATPGLTLPSNVLCQTVGASSSISLSWKQGNSSLTGYYGGFRFLFCVTGGSSCVPGTYLDLSASASSPVTYTFTSTAGGTTQALNVVPNAYYSWLFWENIPSCLFCNGISTLESQLGIGDASPPAAAKLSVKGGTINAGGGITSGNINSIFYVDGVKYATLNAAFTACNASPGCYLMIPPGAYSFSTQVAPTFPAILQGAGASYNNAGSHCTTTLTWTGGASAPFSFSGSSAQGSRLSSVCLNATGAAPPVFVDVDNAASDVELDHVVIDTPTVAATVAAFRWGNTGNVVDPICNTTFTRAAAPIGYDVLNVQAKFTGTNCRSVQSTANEWVLGGTSPVMNFSCDSCSSEASSGNIGILLNYVRGGSFSKLYSECGGTSGSYCVEATAGGSAINNFVFYNPYFSGVQATGATAAIHANNSTAQIKVDGAIMFGTWPNPSYVVKDDACQSILSTGNSNQNTGAAIFSAAPPSGCSLSSVGDIVAGVGASNIGKNIPILTSFTTTASTSDNVTVTGMTSSGHCMLQPTNASADTLLTGTYISAKATNQITVTHASTSGANFDVLCTLN